MTVFSVPGMKCRWVEQTPEQKVRVFTKEYFHEEGWDLSKEERVTDPRTGGEKGKKLERFDLIPVDALEELARAYGRGEAKYAARNWERGYAWSLSFAALMRHAWAWWRGEEVDPESGQSHIIHAAWHCLALYCYKRRGIGTDDRAMLGRDQ